MAARFQDLGHGIYCVDSDLYRPHMAACYMVREGDDVAFIDTGTYHTIPELIAMLETMGLSADNVRYVIPTHIHLDHAGGAGELMARCPNATLVVHPNGVRHMIDPSKLQAGATVVYGEEEFSKHYGHLVPIPAERVIAANDGYVVNLNGRELVFYDTPGHANHHGCIFDSNSQYCFTGDTFGVSYREFDTAQGPWGFLPSTPVAFSPDDWHNSLNKLEALNTRAMLLTHYGIVTDLVPLFAQMRASLQWLRELALAHTNTGENRVAILQEAILQQWLMELQTRGCEVPESEVRALLAVDSDLTAQGLDIWLQRQAKASLKPH